MQGCGQPTSCGLNCSASSRPVPSPICSMAPFPWGQIICTPAEIVAGWHGVCGAHRDGQAHKGRSCQRASPHVGSVLGQTAPCPQTCRTRRHTSGTALSTARFPCLVETEQHVCIPISVLEMQYL